MKVTDKITITNEDNMLLMARYPDNYFDLAIVDPPYRDENQPTKKMRNKIGGKMNDFGKKPNKEYFDELFRISKNQIIWGANNFIENLYSTNCFLFWYKKNPMENYSDGELAWTSFNKVARCIPIDHYGSNTRDKIKTHPTQKPVALYKWILDKYAKEGDKILDTHLGSGSIAIAAHDYKYELTACELDKEYYDKAIQRIQNHVAQQKLF
jgi:site-specific DNA-methyltransferase (adenine-specific)